MAHFYRNIAVGTNEFNEFKSKNSAWKNPNGDKLILGGMDQVCDISN